MFDRVRSWLSGLLLGALFACGTAAQGPWIVDGLNGVDAPGRGTSPANPWKTIGYAMAQATPSAFSATNVVYVVGNQVYSPSTNGETFPVTMRPGLKLEGFSFGSAPSPVLRVPTGQTGIVFSPTQSYGRATSGVRGITVEGGAIGMTLGGDDGFDHDLLVEQCEFRQQAIEGVRVRAQGSQVQEPVFTSCVIRQGAHGMSSDCSAAPGSARVRLENCSFLDLTGTGFALLDSTFLFGAVASVVGCRFERVGLGISMEAGGINGSPSTVALVQNCSFRDVVGSGIAARSSSLAGISLVTESCVFQQCAIGLELASLYGPAVLALRKSAFLSCASGVRCESAGLLYQSIGVTTEFNYIRSCGTGFRFVGDGPFVMQSDRIEGCTTGLLVGNPNSPIYVRSSMFVRNGTGINWFALGAIDGVTVADNLVGVIAVNSMPMGPFSQFTATNSVFAGNGTDLVDQGGIAPILQYVTNCCFQGTNAIDNGNLGLTDPLLSRPTYKLLPGSPCIDRAPAASSAVVDFEGNPRVVVAGGSPATLLDMGADEFVPQGSARPYGTPGIGKGLLFPRISSANTAVRYGTNLTLDLTGALSQLSGQAASSALLTFGWDDDSGSLPMDLGAFGLSGSLLWNDFVTTFPIQPVTAAGTASYTTAIPNNQALVGLTSTYQWFALMPGGDIVSSNGLRATIGQ